MGATNSDRIQVQQRGEGGALLLVTLARPEKANAYTQEMLAVLSRALEKSQENNMLRAIVITGQGDRSFCAGADLNELAGHGHGDAFSLRSRRVFGQLAQMPVPTIAAINGVAIGGGLELALCCDARVCAPGARFSLPEPAIGLIPAAGGTWRLPQVVGPSRARQMILFGEEIAASRALDWGLVSYVGADFLDRALGLGSAVAQRDRLATRAAKLSLVTQAQRDSAVELEAALQAFLYEQRGGNGNAEGR